MTVLSTKHHDHTKEYMFFGQRPTIARSDILRYPRIQEFTTQQIGFFWKPEEVAISKDRSDFLKMEDHERHIFLSNIKYQSLLDSVQGRAPSLVLKPLASLPEVETWITAWEFSETVHSNSYLHIARNVLDDPSSVFDDILNIPEIVNRASSITSAYDRLEEMVYNRTPHTLTDKKEALVECLMSVYALEAIRFYASFATTYSFAKRGVMEGNGTIVELINRDESVHAGGTHFMLTRYLCNLDDPEMTDIIHSKIDFFKNMMRIVYEQECMWADYLFQYGGTVGMNANILKQYLGYITDLRTQDLLQPTVLGVKHNFGDHVITGVKSNPIPWIEQYTNSSNVQKSPQEQELSSYLSGGGIDMQEDLDDMSFLED